VNKILSLEIASDCGLNIPETIVTNSKRELFDFFTLHEGDIICKPISHAGIFGLNPSYFGAYTSKISEDFIIGLPDHFFPCLMQKYIKKKYEVRTFYLEEKCYSMAIFSQADKQTSIDFRKYNAHNPNRYVPYQLPIEVETKVVAFMRAMDLNTGSFDFIRTEDGSYTFLEVNVAGQFGMVSYPCNYNLERKIAEWLIKAAS